MKSVLKTGGTLVLAAISMCVGALMAAVRLLAGAAETMPADDERRLHDSDVFGEMNYRTGRLDAGTDPYGWYDDE